MTIAQLHLLVNSVKKCAWMHHQIGEQSSQKPKWKLRKAEQNSVATLNMHDNWWGMLQDDEPPKSSWRPRKSTKSWHQLTVKKITKVTQSRKKVKVHRVGKLVLPSLVAWRACTKIRDAPAEKRREPRVRRSSTRTEMIFLLCFSAPHWEKILATSGTLCTILSHVMLLNVWNWSLLRSKGKVQNWARRRSYTWISAKLTDWTPDVNNHISWKMEENSVLCEELRARCPGFYRLVLHAPLHLRLLHRYRRTMKIYFCVQQQYEVEIWVNKHTETCYKPSHRTTNKHGETRYRLNCHEDRCNRKRIHTYFLKDRNCEMQEGQNFLDSMQETHRWSHTSSSKSWENWSKNKARSLNWDLWIGKQSPMRCRGTKFGSWKIRDETKTSWSRLGSQKSSTLTIPGIWRYSAKFTMELLKTLRRHLTVQKDLGLLNSGMLSGGEVLRITVAVDQSTVKIGGNDGKNLPFKKKWDCWIAIRCKEEGTFA